MVQNSNSSFGVHTTIELKNLTVTSDNNDIYRDMFQLTSVPVLSNVVVFFSSFVVITSKWAICGLSLLHSVSDMWTVCGAQAQDEVRSRNSPCKTEKSQGKHCRKALFCSRDSRSGLPERKLQVLFLS